MHCSDYKSLEKEVQKLSIPIISSTVWNSPISDDILDDTALGFRPNNAPEGWFPIQCGSDGN